MPTYKDYLNFCNKLIATNVLIYTAKEASQNISALDKQFIIIKHDVEDKPEKALRLSKIEHSLGIKATYYVHSFFLKSPRSVAILKEIASLGHEIGYHYDVMDNNEGDKDKAKLEFEEALNDFKKNSLPIITVCPHGNPLKKRIGYSSNKDFFLDRQIKEYFNDIIDVYITFPDMLTKDYLYITDARYAYFYRDAKSTKTDATEQLIPISREEDIFKMIKEGNSVIISTHSHRYFKFGYIGVIRYILYTLAKCTAKWLYNFKWGRYIIDKFYYIAKKI